MRHFDIEKFKKNAIGTYSLTYEYESLGSIIVQTGAELKSGTTYQENIRRKKIQRLRRVNGEKLFD